MAGVFSTGESLQKSAIQGLDTAADNQFRAKEAETKLKTQAVGNAINTAGSAVGALGALAVRAKKSGILNDIF